MSTTVTKRPTDLFHRPPEEALAIMRQLGMLPNATTEVQWTPDQQSFEPTVRPLARIDTRAPFQTASSSLTAYGPQWYSTDDDPARVSLRGGAIYFSFAGLGANRPCIAWFDLLVYSSPAGSSLTIGASGNPSKVVVTASATGGKRVLVPVGLTADASGEAIAYLVPTINTYGGEWYAARVYGL
jgi:hypothetical protein